jgi:hypothetical protein
MIAFRFFFFSRAICFQRTYTQHLVDFGFGFGWVDRVESISADGEMKL